MPATAGRVRMPANNRVHSSAALQTHGIWQSAIGYDPYAPNKDDDKSASHPHTSAATATNNNKASNSDPDGGENAYASFQGLLALARITNSNADEARGSCKRCGRVGHLDFQCRNFLSVKDEAKDPTAVHSDVMSELGRLRGKKKKKPSRSGAGESEESDDDDESESSDSDSDYDSEIEKIIAKRAGRKVQARDPDSDSGKRKKRGRSKKKKRSSSEKEKRRKRDESSEDDDDEDDKRNHRESRKEKRRRRSHHHHHRSSDSEEESDRRRRKSRRSPSPSGSDAEDSRAGRRGVKRSEKTRKRRYDD